MKESVAIGRPAEIAKDVIIEAGEELLASGRNITGFALRQKLGGGNPNRLKQIWDEHKAGQMVSQSEPLAELPIEVAEELASTTKALVEKLKLVVENLNDRAVKASERRVAEVIRAASEQRDQAERELVDASLTVDDLEAKLAEEKANTADLEKQLADFRAKNQEQAVELAKLRERLELMQRNASTAAEQHTAELDQIRKEVADQKQNQQRLAGEKERLQSELMSLKAKMEAGEESHKDQRKRSADEIQRSAEKLIKIEAERDAARKEAAKVREDFAKLSGQLEATKAQFVQLTEAVNRQPPPPPFQ